MKLKIFMAFIITMFMFTPVSASELDNGLKKECQYIAIGTGNSDTQYNAYLLGVISGIQYMTKDITDFAKVSSFTEKRHKACKNALNNAGSSGFDVDYKREAVKLISK